jgi:hypothetical protein
MGAGLITIDKALGAVLAAESVTLTVKLAVPAAVGVPEMVPVALSESPAGSVPAETDQV